MNENKPAGNQEVVHVTRYKRKVPVYGIFMLVLAVVCIIAVVITLQWLYGVFTNYEKHAPRTALNAYFSQLEQGDYSEIQRTSGFTPDAANSWDDYFALISARFGPTPSKLTFRQTASADLAEGEELYTVFNGEEKLGVLILFPDESTSSGWAVRTTYDYLPGYTITAPEFVQVFMNDAPLEEAAITGSEPVKLSYAKDERTVTVDIFNALNDQSLVPTVVHYETPKTLQEQHFTATTRDGTTVCDVHINEETHTVDITVPMAQWQADELQPVMESAAKAYSDFITQDGSLSALLPYLYSETSLYDDLRGYFTGWYVKHNSRVFEDFAFSELAMRADNIFTGHIDFAVYIYRGQTEFVFNASYDMAYMLVDGQWKMVGLHARPTDLPSGAVDEPASRPGA